MPQASADVYSLLQDDNFREKVRMIEGFISDRDPAHIALIRQTMIADMTRDQHIVYSLARAQDHPSYASLSDDERVARMTEVMELAALEWDHDRETAEDR